MEAFCHLDQVGAVQWVELVERVDQIRSALVAGQRATAAAAEAVEVLRMGFAMAGQTVPVVARVDRKDWGLAVMAG